MELYCGASLIEAYYRCGGWGVCEAQCASAQALTECNWLITLAWRAPLESHSVTMASLPNLSYQSWKPSKPPQEWLLRYLHKWMFFVSCNVIHSIFSISILGVGCDHLQGSLLWEEITLSPPALPAPLPQPILRHIYDGQSCVTTPTQIHISRKQKS